MELTEHFAQIERCILMLQDLGIEADFFDHTLPWITHCSIQSQELAGTAEIGQWREPEAL